MSEKVDDIIQKSFESDLSLYDLNSLFEKKLEEYDLSRTKVATILNIDKDTLNDILNGNSKQPSLANTLKLAYFLDIPFADFVSSVLKNQSSDNYAEIDRGRKASFIAKNFDIKKLTKIGFFEQSDDIEYLTKRILTFFGYDDIISFESNLQKVLFAKSKRPFSDKMKSFWIHSAFKSFESIKNPNEYDREALKEIVVKIRPYCQDIENGLRIVCQSLYNVGVTVIAQNHLTQTQIRGGTFVVNDKPCIVLTDLYKRYTTIWETLIHELYHVLYDIDTIRVWNYHLTGEPDILLIEEKATEFSREYFCGYSKYEFIRQFINQPYIVEKYAKEWEIDKSFIYSSFRQFQEILHKKNYYGAFNEFFPEHEPAIKNLYPVKWWTESSIKDIAVKTKEIFELTTVKENEKESN